MKRSAGMWRLLVLLFACAGGAQAACRDAVVLVHGNAGAPSDFASTRNVLLSRGYAASEILAPDWGSKTCAACNDHAGSEETPVLDAMVEALARSCTGRIDVIGHSMGATLAAKQIANNGLVSRVDAFVGIAGAFRGLWSCGTYPWNVATSTCGAQGLSVGSPLVSGLATQHFGTRAYSIKSYYDQVVCYGGVCTVNGVHSSTVPYENGTTTYTYGHFGLLTSTANKQADLIQ